ncbi:RCC1 domain-containing protein [Brumimicrobium oceani]|uniref:Uncharacterized protein n=1 Tax=Brumimicrobium oceani TaxID=2100725 RepID=A0A2U2XFR1_9FLAO|nr:T9SS type A sorting domain-containing protein [Brumimicrobium oceani]PWH86634.1 hypothetical protein DIT68_05215 [Brumimicrobium oceani]
MKRIILISVLFALNAFGATAADFYWIGGPGSWSDTNHWSNTSGGTTSTGLIPAKGDSIYFDQNSGLSSLTDTVKIDTTILADFITFQGVNNSFTMEALVNFNHTIYGSIVGNSNGINFIGNWGEIIMDAETPGQTISSSGIIWEQDFRFIGLTIKLLDDFITNDKDLYIDSFGFHSNKHSLTLGSFFSTLTSPRTFHFDSSLIIVNNGVWDVNGSNLTSSFTGTEIKLGNTANFASFKGGNQIYDEVNSLSASTTSVLDSNSFKLLELQASGSLTINNNALVNADSIVASGTCGMPFTIRTTSIGTNAMIAKTGHPVLSLSNVIIKNIDAIGAANYDLFLSETQNSSGWKLAPSNFYWIGDSGSWGDPNHWSNTSGGTAFGCIPKVSDSVFFDANSFSSSNQTVSIVDSSYCGFMDWSDLNATQTMELVTALSVYGDMVLSNHLNIKKENQTSSIIVKDDVGIQSNNASIDCNLIIYMEDSASIFELNDDLITSDSTNFLFYNGVLNTSGHKLRTGSIFTSDLPTLDDQRTIYFGSSEIVLASSFNAQDDSLLKIFPGTSHLFLTDTINLSNDLITEGKNFYDVTLDFSPNSDAQKVMGNNNFNKLIITPGSKVYFEQGTTQTIGDSLIAKGNCRDSIFLYSLDTIHQANALISKTGTDVIAECLNIAGLTNAGDPLNALFSKDMGANSNWIFDARPPVTSDFSHTGPICKDDTVHFTNNSTAFSGDPNDITNYWYFNDGSTGYFANPPIDSTFIDYELDTLKHVFIGSGTFDVVLKAEYKNYCFATDTVAIDVILANVSMLSSTNDSIVCSNSPLVFEAFSAVNGTQFEFFYNGVSQNTPSANDSIFTLNNISQGDSVSLVAYEQGCISETIPFKTFDVFAPSTYSWGNNSASGEICKNDTVTFLATSPDSTNSFQFLLNNNSVTGVLDSLATYKVSTLNNNDLVTLISIDTNQCRDTVSSIFTVNPLPNTTLSESSGGNVICQNEELTFTANNADLYAFYKNDVLVQGPSVVDTFWTNNLTSADIISVTGFTNQGCQFEANSEFNYIINSAPTVVLSSSVANNTICSGENVTFTATGAATYEFFKNGVTLQGPSTLNSFASNSLNDNDIISVRGKTSGCFSTEPSIQFTVNNSPTTVLTSNDSDNEICQGTEVEFQASGANNYEFFLDGMSQGASSSLNTFTSSTIQNGQVIEVLGESNGCEVSASVIFSVLTKPNVGIVSSNANNEICDGESISFVATNASNYEFFINSLSVQGYSNNAVLNASNFNFGANTVFAVGSSNNGCVDTSQVIPVLFKPTPTLLVSSSDANNTICQGESVTFTASGGDNYQFVLDGTPQTSMTGNNSFTTSSLSNGQNLIVNGSLNGCASVSNLISTIVNPSPNIALSSSDVDLIFCENEIVDFTASGATNYEFFIDGVSQGLPSTTNTINSSNILAGSHTVMVEGESNNCVSTESLIININNVPLVNLVTSDVDNSICNGEAVTYTASGASLYEFFINGTSQGVLSPTSTLQINSLANNDIVSVQGSSALGCQDLEAYSPIEVLPLPNVSLTSTSANQSICTGESVIFTANGASSYQFFVNGTSIGASSPTNTTTLNTLNYGDVVSVTGDLLGCTATSNALSFQVFGYPTVSLTNNADTVLCVGEPANITANGANEYLFYVNGAPMGNFAPNNNFMSAVNNGDIITVEGQANGCSSFSSSSVTYSVFNYPNINVISSHPNLNICLNDTVDFNATGANEYTYALNGLQLSSNATGFFQTNNIPNNGVVSVTGFNAHCASNPADFTFTVNEMNLEMSISPSNMICEGDNVQFTATGADEYEFLVNGLSASPQGPLNTFTSNFLNHHDEVTFKGFNTTSGCTQDFNDFIIMNVLETPVITPLTGTTFCEGDSVILLSNAVYGNTWLFNNNPIAGESDTLYVADTTGSYSLQVTMGGTNDLWSLGQNSNGVFGNGSSFNSSLPVASNSGINFTEISAGFNFVMGIDENKSLFAWGNNASGQLGNGTYTSTNSPIQIGSFTNIKTIATGANSTMATTEQGEVYVWGNNNHGQLGLGNNAVVNFPVVNTTLTNIDTIAAGRSHYVILSTNGTVQTVGNNDFGQLGNGTLNGSSTPIALALSNIVAVGANEYASFAIDSNGELYAWGNNSSGQLGLGDVVSRLTPTLSDLKDVVSVQGGANHTVFLTEDHKVYSTGGNSYGQLGNSSQTPSLYPREIDIQGVNMIAAGQYSTLMKRKDNSVFAAGNNTENQLSEIADTAIISPVHMSQLEGVTFIESSRNASHFLYGQNKTCASAAVTTSFSPAPAVSISSVGDVLETNQPVADNYQWFFNGNLIPGANSPTYSANSSGIYTVEVFYANGCSSFSDDYYHSVANLEKYGSFSLTLYPNPANDELNVEFSESIEMAEIIIFDAVGKVISMIDVNSNKLSISCQHLENGVYYLQISGKYGTALKKFIVKH